MTPRNLFPDLTLLTAHDCLQIIDLATANMPDTATVGILIFFFMSSAFGHLFLHKVIRTPAQYTRPNPPVEAKKSK